MKRRAMVCAVAALLAVTAVTGCGGGQADGRAASTSATGPGSSSRTSPAAPSSTSAGTTPAATSTGRAPSSTTAPSTTSTTSRPTASSRTTTTTTTTTAGSVPAALRGTDWERIPTSRRVVALTFDGGSSDTSTSSILATLKDNGVHATFFLTGDFARRYPAQVRRIAAGGHRLGNHSDRHLEYPKLTNVEIRADLARAEAAIRAAGGPQARPLFRFPFGARTPADIRVVNDAGYVPVRWTVDSLGWKGTSGGGTASAVVQRVLDTARPGQIVLMHLGANPDDGTTFDADALPRIISGLRARGYSFVTLEALLS